MKWPSSTNKITFKWCKKFFSFLAPLRNEIMFKNSKPAPPPSENPGYAPAIQNRSDNSFILQMVMIWRISKRILYNFKFSQLRWVNMKEIWAFGIWTNNNIKYSINWNCISKGRERELRKVSMTTDTKNKMTLKLN